MADADAKKEQKDIDGLKNNIVNAVKAVTTAITATTPDPAKLTAAIAALKKVYDPFTAKYVSSTNETAKKLIAESDAALKDADAAMPKLVAAAQLAKDSKEIDGAKSALVNAVKAVQTAITATTPDPTKLTAAVTALKKLYEPFTAKWAASTIETATKLIADCDGVLKEADVALPKQTVAFQLAKDTKEIESQRSSLTNAYKTIGVAIASNDEKKLETAVAGVKKVYDPFVTKYSTSTIEAAVKLLAEGATVLADAETAKPKLAAAAAELKANKEVAAQVTPLQNAAKVVTGAITASTPDVSKLTAAVVAYKKVFDPFVAKFAAVTPPIELAKKMIADGESLLKEADAAVPVLTQAIDMLKSKKEVETIGAPAKLKSVWNTQAATPEKVSDAINVLKKVWEPFRATYGSMNRPEVKQLTELVEKELKAAEDALPTIVETTDIKKLKTEIELKGKPSELKSNMGRGKTAILTSLALYKPVFQVLKDKYGSSTNELAKSVIKDYQKILDDAQKILNDIELAAQAEAKAAGPSVLGDLSSLSEEFRATILLEEIKALKQGGNGGKDPSVWSKLEKFTGSVGWSFRCDFGAFMACEDLSKRFKDDCPRQIFRGLLVEVVKGFESFCKDEYNKAEIEAVIAKKQIGLRFVKDAELRKSQRFKIMQYRVVDGALWVECDPKSFMNQPGDLSNIHHFDEALTQTAPPRAPADSKQATDLPHLDLRFPLFARRLYRDEAPKIAAALQKIRDAAGDQKYTFTYDWFGLYVAAGKSKFPSSQERFAAIVRDYYEQAAKGIAPALEDPYTLEWFLHNTPTRNIRLTGDGNADVQWGNPMFGIVNGECQAQFFMENFSSRASDLASSVALERALDLCLAKESTETDPKLNKMLPLTIRKQFRELEPRKLAAEESMLKSSGLPFKFLVDAPALFFHKNATGGTMRMMFPGQITHFYESFAKGFCEFTSDEYARDAIKEYCTKLVIEYKYGDDMKDDVKKNENHMGPQIRIRGQNGFITVFTLATEHSVVWHYLEKEKSLVHAFWYFVHTESKESDWKIDKRLPLQSRRNLRDTESKRDAALEQLSKLTGSKWSFTADLLSWYTGGGVAADDSSANIGKHVYDEIYTYFAKGFTKWYSNDLYCQDAWKLHCGAVPSLTVISTPINKLNSERFATWHQYTADSKKGFTLLGCIDTVQTNWIESNISFDEPFDYHRAPASDSKQPSDFKLDLRVGLSVRRQMRDREAEYHGYLKQFSELGGYKVDWPLWGLYNSNGLSHKQRHVFVDRLVHGHMRHLATMWKARYENNKEKFDRVCSSRTFKWKWGNTLRVAQLTKPGHWLSEGGCLVFECHQPEFTSEESGFDAGDWHDFMTVFGEKRPLCDRCGGAGKLSCEAVNCHFTMQHPNHKCRDCGGTYMHMHTYCNCCSSRRTRARRDRPFAHSPLTRDQSMMIR